MLKYSKVDPRHSLAERANVLRLLALYEYGGIYLDFNTTVNDWGFFKLFSCEGLTYFVEEQK